MFARVYVAGSGGSVLPEVLGEGEGAKSVGGGNADAGGPQTGGVKLTEGGTMASACRHCEAELSRAGGAARGLCWKCYRDPLVKALYPTRLRGPGGAAYGYEPTSEEIEQMVSAQLACLPDWWAAECERERDAAYVPKVFTLVKCS